MVTDTGIAETRDISKKRDVIRNTGFIFGVTVINPSSNMYLRATQRSEVLRAFHL